MLLPNPEQEHPAQHVPRHREAQLRQALLICPLRYIVPSLPAKDDHSLLSEALACLLCNIFMNDLGETVNRLMRFSRNSHLGGAARAEKSKSTTGRKLPTQIQLRKNAANKPVGRSLHVRHVHDAREEFGKELGSSPRALGTAFKCIYLAPLC